MLGRVGLFESGSDGATRGHWQRLAVCRARGRVESEDPATAAVLSCEASGPSEPWEADGMLVTEVLPKEDTREVRTYSRGRTVTRASRDETCMPRVATRVATLGHRPRPPALARRPRDRPPARAGERPARRRAAGALRMGQRSVP